MHPPRLGRAPAEIALPVVAWFALIAFVLLSAIVIPMAYAGLGMITEGSRDPRDYAALAVGVMVPVAAAVTASMLWFRSRGRAADSRNG